MNLTVFKGPCPSANIDRLLISTPLNHGSVFIVVPDFYSAVAMEKRIAVISGNAMFGLRTLTMEELAKTILSASHNPPEIIKSHIKKALLGEIIKSRIGAKSEFSSISNYQGFITVMSRFIEDYRGAGNIPLSRRDLLSVISAYESHLKRMDVTDHEGLISMALHDNRIENFAGGFEGTLIFDGFYDMTENQLEMSSRLFKSARRSSVTLTWDKSNTELFTLPDRLLKRFSAIGAKIIDVEPLITGIPDAALFGFINKDYSFKAESGKIEIHNFRNGQSEGKWIAGKIHELISSGKCFPEDIMIVSRNMPAWDSPVINNLIRFGIPIEGGVKKSLILNPVVKFILKAIEASIEPTDEKITEICRSSFVSDKPAAVYLHETETELAGWSCMISESDRPSGFVSSIKRMTDVLGLYQNLDGGGNAFKALSERAAYSLLMNCLDEFADFYGTFRPMLKAKEFIILLENFLSGIFYSENVHPGAGILVADANLARNICRKVTFVYGLDNSSFPQRNIIFSLHDDDTSNQIRKKKDAEEGILFYLSLYGSMELYLCYPGLNDEGGDSSMSPFLREIQDGMVSGIQTFVHSGVCGDSWETGFATEKGRHENLIRFLSKKENPAGFMDIIYRESAGESLYIEDVIKRSIFIIENKGMDVTKPESFETLSRLYGHDKIFGVTELEKYNECPISFFLERLLGIEKNYAESEGLEPGVRGTLIHNTLSDYYSILKEKYGSEFSSEIYRDSRELLLTCFDKQFEKLYRELKRIHPLIISSEKRKIARLLVTFHETELNYFRESKFVPDLFEKGFGYGDLPCLSISLNGDTVNLKGRIDRIDVMTSDNSITARVIDYKTGLNPTKKDILSGDILQMPLYMRASEELILEKIPVVEGIYYNLPHAEYDNGKMILKNCTILDTEKDNIREIIEKASGKAVNAAVSIRKGMFPAPDKCYDTCMFRTVCREDRSVKKEESIAGS